MSRHFPNFIDAVVDFVDTSDVPMSHKTWAALSLVAAALERKVWLPTAEFTVFANLYVFLISPSGSFKSTFTGKIVNIASKVSGITMLPRSMSESAFIDALTRIGTKKEYKHADGQVYRMSAGYFFADEAATGFKELHQNGSLIPFLTDIYNCGDRSWSSQGNYSRQTLKDGLRTIHNPCVNILTCSTPDWLMTKVLNQNDIEGGFGSRILLVVDKDHKRTAHGLNAMTEKVLGAERDLSQDLAHINTLCGAYTWDTSFSGLWEELSKTNEDRKLQADSPMMRNFYARKITQATKVAMLIAASEADELVLRSAHLERSWNLLTALEATMLTPTEAKPDPMKKNSALFLLNYLKAHPELKRFPKPKIVKLMLEKEFTTNEINGAVTALFQAKVIELDEEHRKKIGTTTVWFKVGVLD